ncbi:histone-like nucleoid-structuring protein Lsr2 [Saccharopolyspora phatthalungensis]|uniref:ATPase subunit of ABC transporter with duplicated ATPase domains n=1 Tax=Saccharopolyspora phatthalungensis TaxID=664693 RepID=A0A840PZL6_9PSEU|nr:Lsr2 family protein [Saccharopolyspora phatthalungensis]MBB5153197.1 ATPase subunit of ABC transporter with duplicated ATPase domains [Saccharopolyspora phatthalungensis]
MAERIQVELVDDIDGSPANHTVTFALDGATYEIDLNDAHAQQLRAVLDRYVKAARAPKPEPARSTRQQERAEEQARQANKQLTEQIRGAAQRTREHLSKKAADRPEPESVKQPEPAEETLFDTSPAEEQKQDAARVPAVSMPQFSSAVD